MKKWGDITQATLNKLFMTSDEASRQNYNDKMRYIANECLNLIANDVKPNVKSLDIEVSEPVIVTMDDDFLSFSDLPVYLDGEKTGEYKYYGYGKIKIYAEGTYTLYYNALWDNITEDDINNNNDLNIDTSVLMCLPSYIASQLLSQDDLQRSAILRNEFEMMLERLDLNETTDYRSFIDDGGWV